MERKFRMLSACVLATLAGGGGVQAQDTSFGEEIYKTHCVVCHGEAGAGDGMVGVLFTQPPSICDCCHATAVASFRPSR